jgi:DNA repair exonuclease SbcCD ATPase subunit
MHTDTPTPCPPLPPIPINASGALYVNAKKDVEYEVARRAREEIRKQAAEEAKKEKEEKEEKEKKEKEEKEEKEENNKQEEGQEEGQEKEKEEAKEEGKETAAAPPPPSVSAETNVAATLPVVMPTSTVPASAMKEEEINAILTMEENMVKVDQELKAIEDSKNALESFVYGDQFLFIVHLFIDHVHCSSFMFLVLFVLFERLFEWLFE